MTAIDELKVRARILHKKIQATDVRLRDCLSRVATDFGFANWPQAKAVLSGNGEVSDFGTMLCPPRNGGGHLNLWYARYEEAAAARESCQGYLLAYRRQFFVVDRYYIEDMGLDPDDADWAELGFDWVRPRSLAARARLYDKLVATFPREGR